MNERITMVMSTLSPDNELLNKSLQSAKGFDEIILFIDPGTKEYPHVDVLSIVPPLRILEHDKHLEVNEAYDFLINAAFEGWVCTFFDDDYFDEAELKRVIDFVKNNDIKEDIVHFRSHMAGDLSYHQWGKEQVSIGELEFDNCLPAASFFRKKVWRAVGGLRGEIAHDWIFWLRAAYMGFEFKYFNACPVWFNYQKEDSIYRRHLKEKCGGSLEKAKQLVLSAAREGLR